MVCTKLKHRPEWICDAFLEKQKGERVKWRFLVFSHSSFLPSASPVSGAKLEVKPSGKLDNPRRRGSRRQTEVVLRHIAVRNSEIDVIK